MEEPFPILSHLAELATGGVGSAVVGCNLHSERYAVVHNQPEYGFVTRQSVFEIGSITKVITGILLAAMVERGEVSLSDSVQSVVGISDLPEIWSSISLLDLATHRSGLPRLPPNLEGPFWNPYQGWDSCHLHHAMRLSGYHGIPCGRPNYSNFGIAVLAEALARRAGIPYAELVTRRICQPLGLHATVATRQQCAEQRAIGYTSSGQRARPWDFDAMTGAAGLSSTVDDLLSVTEGILGLRPTPLATALQTSVVPVQTIDRHSSFALGWSVIRLNKASVAWASGRVAGFASYAALHLDSRVALVVLSNSGENDEVARSGFGALSRLCSI